MLNHTPGPWKYEKGDEESGNEGRHFVCHPETECDETTVCETNYGEDDARLIAVAPEMLEALINVQIVLESMKIESLLISEIIEKATGQKAKDVIACF